MASIVLKMKHADGWTDRHGLYNMHSFQEMNDKIEYIRLNFPGGIIIRPF
jgi:hypothetical protein